MIVNRTFINSLLLILGLVSSTIGVSQNVITVNDDSGCAPLVAIFNYTGGGDPTNLLWNFGNTITLEGDPSADPGLLTPAISYLTSGYYTVSLEVTTASGTTNYSYTNFITVFEDPSAAFSANTTTGCGAFPVSFTDLSNPGSATINQWNWDFGDAGSSTIQNPTYVYNTVGTFDVSLSVTDINGCNSIFTIENYISSTDGVYPDFSVDNTYSCEIPTTVTITNESSGAGTLSYNWDFGNTTSSTSANPSPVSYADYGSYIISLELSNNLGCTQTAYQVVNIIEYNVDFISDLNCIPEPSTFVSTSDASFNTFTWDFGDPASGNNTAYSAATNHVFSSPGTYTVTLTASINGNCEQSYSMDMEVLRGGVIDYTIDPTLVCDFPQDVSITINNDNIDSYVWFVSKVGEGLYDSGNILDPTLSFDNTLQEIEEGYYNISISVNFDNGCSGFVQENNFLLVDSIDIDANVIPNQLCLGDSIVGIDETYFLNGIDSYEWDWDDGEYSYDQVSGHVYSEPGNYDVVLTLTSPEGCIGQKKMDVSVGILTDPSFTFPDTTICVEEEVVFTYTGDPDIVDSYYWNFEGFLVSQVQNGQIEFINVDTIHTISLITVNNGCIDTTSQSVSIVSLGPKAEFISDPPFFCKEETPYISTFINTTDSTENTIYQWEFGDEELDTLYQKEIGDIEFFGKGAHLVTLIATDTVTGCSNDMFKGILVDSFLVNYNNMSILENCDSLLFEASSFGTDTLFLDHRELRYYWDFGDGDTTSSLNFPETEYVNHSYSEPGSFFQKVYATNEYGCADTAYQTIIIHPSPIATFTTSNADGCPPFNLDVQNSSIEMDTAIVSFEYTFIGDSVYTYEEENPSIPINDVGPYYLNLSIVDGYGCSSISSTQIIAPHIIDFDYVFPEYLCYDTEYEIENNTSSDYPPLDYFWEFGNGTNSTEENPSITISPDEGEAFINYVTVTDNTGCTQLDSFNIQISIPNLSYSYQIDEAACPPIYSDFGLFSFTPIDTFIIDYGDGDFNYVNTLWEAQNMSHVYHFPGYYDVTFSVIDIYGCRSDSIVDSLVFVPGPWAEFTFSPNSGCPPLEVTFEILEQNNVNDYFWVFGDGYISIEEEPTHTYLLAGTYTPILIIEDSIDVSVGDSISCMVSIIGDDLIIDGPILNFFVIDDTICFGQNVGLLIDNLTQTIPGFEISSYLWDFGDGNFSSEENPPEHLYDEPGFYGITLTVNTVNGCEYTLTKENAVFIMESPMFSPYIEYEPSCPPMQVNFYGDTATNIDPEIHYLWDFGDQQQSTEMSPNHIYNEEGAYSLSLLINYFNCTFTSSLDENIETFSVPEASIIALPLYENGDLNEVQLNNASEDEEYIEWYGNSIFISSENQINLSAQNDSLYVYLVAYSKMGCPDTALFSINDFQWEIPNIITPNGDGFNDYFELNFEGFGPCIGLNIYNRWGLLIYENASYKDNWDGKDKNGDDVSDGTYFYILNICNKSKVSGYITVIRKS